VAEEAKSALGEHIQTIQVKRALARTIAECLPPAKTFQLIKDGVKKGLVNKNKCLVFKVAAPFTDPLTSFDCRLNLLIYSVVKIKSLLLRDTGRSALTRKLASVGALLPYYVSMKNHKTFK